MDAEQIARGIELYAVYGGLGAMESQRRREQTWGKIAAALREYGEAKKCEGIDAAERLFDSKYKQADAEGYRRGLEDAQRMAEENFSKKLLENRPTSVVNDIHNLLQRGKGSGE